MNVKRTSLALLIGAVSIFSSCESGNKTEITKENTEEHDQHDHDHDAIELNNGEKWEVVSEMLGHIRSMEKDVNEFQNVEEKKYDVLAEKLTVNLDLLTSNCTMTGKAHDELHKWLLPYIELVDEITNAENDEEAKAAYTSIQSSFKTFNTFFK